MAYDFRLTDSLTKVFPLEDPESLSENKFILLKDEILNFQLAYRYRKTDDALLDLVYEIETEAEIANNTEVAHVELIPATMPLYDGIDDGDYLFTHAKLAPDLLQPRPVNIFRPYLDEWRSLWFQIMIPSDLEAGEYSFKLNIKMYTANNTAQSSAPVLWTKELKIEVLPASLPAQTLINTAWFHGDCLADYYNVEVFSEEHWRILANFMQAAVRNGSNMLLTPVFTPPLDTALGGERTTIQLVGVKRHAADEDKREFDYEFDFTLLSRWIDLAEKNGIKYFEIAHLFTQWGAKFCPKIMAKVTNALGEEESQKIFGWQTRADSNEYKEFLEQFLPALTSFLQEKNVLENTYFHISDEPSLADLESYKSAKALVAPFVAEDKIIDALSDYEFYETGAITSPIPANNKIQDFLDHDVKNLWTYYCCVQAEAVSNRFVAMPSARNRILGLQMYLFDIKGFLQWGFNFYNAQFSRFALNPYVNTDAINAFPTGDSFLVYPGINGEALDSIRGRVFVEALQDLRKFKFLAEISAVGENSAANRENGENSEHSENSWTGITSTAARTDEQDKPERNSNTGKNLIYALVDEVLAQTGCAMHVSDISFTNYPKGAKGQSFLLKLDELVSEAIKTRLAACN